MSRARACRNSHVLFAVIQQHLHKPLHVPRASLQHLRPSSSQHWAVVDPCLLQPTARAGMSARCQWEQLDASSQAPLPTNQHPKLFKGAPLTQPPIIQALREVHLQTARRTGTADHGTCSQPSCGTVGEALTMATCSALWAAAICSSLSIRRRCSFSSSYSRS